MPPPPPQPIRKSSRDSRADSEWPREEPPTAPMGVEEMPAQAFRQMVSRIEKFEETISGRVGQFEWKASANERSISEMSLRVTKETEINRLAVASVIATQVEYGKLLAKLDERGRIADIQSAWIRGIIAGLVLLALGETFRIILGVIRK